MRVAVRCVLMGAIALIGWAIVVGAVVGADRFEDRFDTPRPVAYSSQFPCELRSVSDASCGRLIPIDNVADQIPVAFSGFDVGYLIGSERTTHINRCVGADRFGVCLIVSPFVIVEIVKGLIDHFFFWRRLTFDVRRGSFSGGITFVCDRDREFYIICVIRQTFNHFWTGDGNISSGLIDCGFCLHVGGISLLDSCVGETIGNGVCISHHFKLLICELPCIAIGLFGLSEGGDSIGMLSIGTSIGVSDGLGREPRETIGFDAGSDRSEKRKRQDDEIDDINPIALWPLWLGWGIGASGIWLSFWGINRPWRLFWLFSGLGLLFGGFGIGWQAYAIVTFVRQLSLS